MSIRVTGLSETLTKLNASSVGIKGKTFAGLIRGGEIVKRESMLKSPVDTGNLKASSFITIGKMGKTIFVGYTAEYAIFVHEDENAHHPVGESKFLENALVENFDAIKQALRDVVVI